MFYDYKRGLDLELKHQQLQSHSPLSPLIQQGAVHSRKLSDLHL